MTSSTTGHKYRVQRTSRGTAGFDVALVRYAPRNPGLLDRLRRLADDGQVLFHRRFRPMGEVEEIEAYASQLALIASHANAGTFGCFVDTTTPAGAVKVTLYERWFDGQRLRCELLAERSFDPEDDSSLVASAEFRGQLESWAEDRNDDREAEYLAAVDDNTFKVERATERRDAADSLARILSS